MGEYLVISDDVGRSGPLARSLSVDHPCHVYDLYSEKIPDLRPRVVISDVIHLNSSALVRMQLYLTKVRGKGVPHLFIMHGDVSRAQVNARFLSANLLLSASIALEQGLAKLRELDEKARPISALAHKFGCEAQSYLQAVFFSGGPMTPSSADAGTSLIVRSIKDVNIREWIKVVQGFDDITYQHIMLVAGLANSFAVSLGLNKTDEYHLTKGALLHDVGKTRIPPRILNKPGRFTPDELAIMQSHAALGHEMLIGGGFADDTMMVVRSHHEMLDGSGYPDRLKGADIPDLVRLVTVCDIYAALIEQRPYKPAIHHMKALSILQEMEGRLDPDIVRAFHAVAVAVGGTETPIAA